MTSMKSRSPKVPGPGGPVGRVVPPVPYGQPGPRPAGAERAGQLKLVKVDVDKSPELARRFDARSIPTLLIIDGGEVVSRQVGAAPPHALKSWVDDALASKR